MKIELHLPRDFDATVEFDPNTRVVTIVPRERAGTLPLLGMVTISDDGLREKRTVVGFDLTSGIPTLGNKRQSQSPASFDDKPGELTLD
jgi:hypothetical protein